MTVRAGDEELVAHDGERDEHVEHAQHVQQHGALPPLVQAEQIRRIVARHVLAPVTALRPLRGGRGIGGAVEVVPGVGGEESPVGGRVPAPGRPGTGRAPRPGPSPTWRRRGRRRRSLPGGGNPTPSPASASSGRAASEAPHRAPLRAKSRSAARQRGGASKPWRCAGRWLSVSTARKSGEWEHRMVDRPGLASIPAGCSLSFPESPLAGNNEETEREREGFVQSDANALCSLP
ncbi:hypothetical protein SKAU_G00344060 [Synaphobranchus kaupii]|uniref:Uncharacterized protein n=1 Tax=Synaphobranchus kaupii TaxID=118154 RepID=A0A9Q1EJ59_SYNKA|nr:hypothetical protein SKAU_G00344060 [Synaphobranchus kaupii]